MSRGRKYKALRSACGKKVHCSQFVLLLQHGPRKHYVKFNIYGTWIGLRSRQLLENAERERTVFFCFSLNIFMVKLFNPYTTEKYTMSDAC